MDAVMHRVWRSAERAASHRFVRYLLIVAYDALIAACALTGAFLLRFDGKIPLDLRGSAPDVVAGLLAVRVLASALFGLYRWSFLMSGLLEAVRLVTATATGTVLFVAWSRIAAGSAPLPRSVIALEFFLTTSLMAAYRFGPRLLVAWAHEHRPLHGSPMRRTLVLGAGNSGDLLLRDLSRTQDHPYFVVGLVDDDPVKAGSWIGGKPVLGGTRDLPRLIAEHRISTVMLAIPTLAGERVREILRLCSRRKVSFKIVRSSFSAGHPRLGAGTVHDLAPDDLLERPPVSFDASEIRALVQGRRILITGGGGSIGGEIATQVAAQGARLVVLVDMNENELYLRFRRLRESFPSLEVRAEVADVREPARLLRLGQRYAPQDVFHAAAHKHVPLMEDAPEEAIKNNVFGTLNVAAMASACGAERLVFISTDKAVKPSSMMGASKRIAELVVRDLARRSRTRMTAVRFGNVLGSAGSVVPIFKQQIERGGPVTLTHPGCTRYFMTIPEAVGLVLVAGLSGYGELCVLDMGEPIRIADLAENMITMAGYLPGAEIPIVFSGLRRGEKLHEELLTEDEERAHVVRSRVKVARSPPPPPDLAERLRELRQAAAEADREALTRAVRVLVPSYTPDRGGAPAPAPAQVAVPVLRPARSRPRVPVPEIARAHLDAGAIP